MHNKGFVRQAYRTGARKQTLLGRAAAGRGWALSRASIIMISTPVPSHPPPLDQDLDTITHPGDMITPDTALSLFCPGWQQQHATCLCLDRDSINIWIKIIQHQKSQIR